MLNISGVVASAAEVGRAVVVPQLAGLLGGASEVHDVHAYSVHYDDSDRIGSSGAVVTMRVAASLSQLGHATASAFQVEMREGKKHKQS